MSAEANAEFEQRGGGIPKVNPRALAGITMPIHDTRIDSDFIDEDGRKKSVICNELFAPFDADYICMCRLQNLDDVRPMAAVVRSKKQGPFRRDEREALASVAPELSRALSLHARVQSASIELAIGTFGSFQEPALWIDALGRVTGGTDAGEALFDAPAVFRVDAGRLRSVDTCLDLALQDAIAKVCSRTLANAPGILRVPLRNTAGQIYRAELAQVPWSPWSISRHAAIIFIRRHQRALDSLTLIRAAFALTLAEAEVASDLTLGHSIREIAQMRDVSVETVRAQVKAVCAKLGVSRQAELMRIIWDLTY
ncbi:MAG TPA: helix-turn-helix transcriptional regulator [Micropepsaceae bacterium]|nr:helix-turn-helix transcriptional regulator [Micropepsaceae bacterium]